MVLVPVALVPVVLVPVALVPVVLVPVAPVPVPVAPVPVPAIAPVALVAVVPATAIADPVRAPLVVVPGLRGRGRAREGDVRDRVIRTALTVPVALGAVRLGVVVGVGGVPLGIRSVLTTTDDLTDERAGGVRGVAAVGRGGARRGTRTSAGRSVRERGRRAGGHTHRQRPGGHRGRVRCRVVLEHAGRDHLLADDAAQARTQPPGGGLAAGHVHHHQGARDRHDRERHQGWLVVEEEARPASGVHRGRVSRLSGRGSKPSRPSGQDMTRTD